MPIHLFIGTESAGVAATLSKARLNRLDCAFLGLAPVLFDLVNRIAGKSRQSADPQDEEFGFQGGHSLGTC